jgi:hypothetical protein
MLIRFGNIDVGRVLLTRLSWDMADRSRSAI